MYMSGWLLILAIRAAMGASMLPLRDLSSVRHQAPLIVNGLKASTSNRFLARGWIWELRMQGG